MLASAIMNSARISLRDPLPGLVWTEADMLRFLNEGERWACLMRPDLYTLRAAIPMTAGTLQTLPVGATALFRLDENVVGKQRCRLVDSAMLDVASRMWPAATQESTVQEYCVDVEDRKRFHVLPPNDGTGSVVAHYGTVPPELTASTDAINLGDTYDLVLKHFILGVCFAFATPRQDMASATAYHASAEKMLMLNVKAEQVVAPTYGATPGGA